MVGTQHYDSYRFKNIKLRNSEDIFTDFNEGLNIFWDLKKKMNSSKSGKEKDFDTLARGAHTKWAIRET